MTVVQMKKERRTFTSEFKNQMVHLYKNGKRKCDIIKEYEIAPSMLDRWINQSATSGSYKEKDNRTAEEQEIIKLRKDLQ